MKLINKLLFTALVFAAASFTAAGSAPTDKSAKSVFDRSTHIAHSINFVRRVVTAHIDHIIERQLDFQTDLAVAAMYEAPTSIKPIEIQIDL
jgi:hypothetical protein|tara:strand:+ start:60396 stop:60671 length:276 start_codon:yes stop_codon:yes gene_type:complete